MLAQLQADYPDEIRIVYRHFPLLSIHDKAALATQASEAAGKQGEFWEMHDLLFEKQAEWSEFSVDDFEAWLVERATELGLDADQFQADMTAPAAAALAQKAWHDGVSANLPGTLGRLHGGFVLLCKAESGAGGEGRRLIARTRTRRRTGSKEKTNRRG